MKKVFGICLLFTLLSGCYSVVVQNKDSSYEFFLLLKSASQKDINSFLNDQSSSKRTDILNNSSNPYGLSSIAVVILEKRPELIEKLMEYGADVNAKGTNGSTALHIASSLAELSTAQKLVKDYQAKLIANDEGQTPIHYAALRAKNPVLPYLLAQFSGSVNKQDKAGNNALYYAVTVRDNSNISVLLQYKADSTTINTNKETPLSYSQKMNYDAITNILSKKKVAIPTKKRKK